MMKREFTGRHMAAAMVGGFAVVVAVNFYMASLAIGGFGGVVVKNSYVASQKFNGWLEQAREADRLGYSAAIGKDDDGRLLVSTTGVPDHARLTANLRRPLGRPDDTMIALERLNGGVFVSPAALPDGRWIVRLTVEADGTRWADQAELR